MKKLTWAFVLSCKENCGENIQQTIKNEHVMYNAHHMCNEEIAIGST